MKLKNKILTLIAGTLTTFALTSCNDFLDRDPLGQFTEDDAPNALIGGKMYNVYYLMRSYNITAGIPAFMIHMVRSEDSEKGSDAGDGSNEAAARYIRARLRPTDAVLCYEEELPLYKGCQALAYGREADPHTLSAGLFAALRALDRPDITAIYARCPEGGGVAYAVGNRLKKAAAFRVVDAEHEA